MRPPRAAAFLQSVPQSTGQDHGRAGDIAAPAASSGGAALASPALAAAVAPLQPPLPADGAAAAPAASSGAAAFSSPALAPPPSRCAPWVPPRCTPRNCLRPRRCVPASLPCLPPPAATPPGELRARSRRRAPAAAAAARRRCCRPLHLVVADPAASSLIHSARRLRPSSRGGRPDSHASDVMDLGGEGVDTSIALSVR